MNDAASITPEETERHASWPELFFDLVAVAGVGVVARQLEADQPWQHVAVLGVIFIAFWILWASVTTYGNLLADNASIAVLFASMAVLGIMVASVPGIYGEHARVFAVAYVAGRLIISRPWSRASVVMDMPIAQTPVGIVPWIVSIWVDGDARYWLWGLGVGLDLWALVTESGERRLEQSQQRLDRVLTMRSQRSEKTIERYERQGGRNREFPTTITPLKGDVAHRSERMALFILIVLGEGIVQLTVAAEASEHWNRSLLVAAVGAFLLVCTLFFVAVARGTAGLALLPGNVLSARPLWVGHLVVAMSLVTLVAALGQLLEDPAGPVSTHTAWMLALGVSVYGLVSAGAHLLAGSPKRWSIAFSLAAPLVAAGALVLATHSELSASGIGWILTGAVAVAAVFAGRTILGPRPEKQKRPA